MTKTLQFWMDRDVDGFRIDAINHAFEDQRFLDEPVIPDVDPNLHTSLDHIYTTNLEASYKMVEDWRTMIEEWNTKNPTKAPK